MKPNHLCETQILNIVEEIQLALDHHLPVDLILIDFRKAFDTVPHQHLLKKLYHYGIQGNIYNWISSWLTKRQQRVVIKGHNSFYVHVNSGVPQGTVLGPLMFLLYINDITTNISSNIRLFADDCVLLIYCNTAARGLTDIYARLPRADISVKPRARPCSNIYVTLSIIVYSAARNYLGITTL